MNKKFEINLTGVLIKDNENNGFTGYFAEMPEAIAEGDSPEETTINLFEALKSIFEFKKEEMQERLSYFGDNITTQPMKFEFSE
jgi:predicted RNase H-like HicB family nuclease